MVTWRVGVLFSRSGATAVSETEHFFGTALAIEELNNAGGVLGKPIEPVVYDPTSDPLTYRRYAERLLGDDAVNVIFGCSTSSCRKAVLPVVERRNGLLWYPSLYEGFEYSPNVIYTGAAPNQNSFQLSEYLIQNGCRHFYFIGTDYIYPRKSNRIMRDLVESRGGEVVRSTCRWSRATTTSRRWSRISPRANPMSCSPPSSDNRHGGSIACIRTPASTAGGGRSRASPW